MFFYLLSLCSVRAKENIWGEHVFAGLGVFFLFVLGGWDSREGTARLKFSEFFVQKDFLNLIFLLLISLLLVL